jgi:hypothetical protein
MQGMESYSKAATERAMKVQEVILRAVACAARPVQVQCPITSIM